MGAKLEIVLVVVEGEGGRSRDRRQDQGVLALRDHATGDPEQRGDQALVSLATDRPHAARIQYIPTRGEVLPLVEGEKERMESNS